MNPFLAIPVVILIVGLIAFGLSRKSPPRLPSLEGIYDIEVARAYDRISRLPQFRLIRHMVANRLSRYKPAGTLADVGCGPGYLAILIAIQYNHLHVVGFDNAPEMTETAGQNAAALGISDRVDFREGDVHQLPVENDSLNFIISTMSLHHWSNPRQALAEFHRALIPGGQLLIFDLRRDAWRVFHWLLGFAQKVVVPAPLRRINEPRGSLLASYSLAELKDLFSHSSFTEHKLDGGPAWTFTWASKSP